jgi:hypothetical protein
MATNQVEFDPPPNQDEISLPPPWDGVDEPSASRITDTMRVVFGNPNLKGGTMSREVTLSPEVTLLKDGTGAIIVNDHYYIIYVQNAMEGPCGYTGSRQLDIVFPVTTMNTLSLEKTKLLQMALDIMYHEALSVDDEDLLSISSENKEYMEAYNAPCKVSTTAQGPFGTVRAPLRLNVLYRSAVGLDHEPVQPISGEKPMRKKYLTQFGRWVVENGGEVFHKASDDFKMIQWQRWITLGTYQDQKELLQFYGLPQTGFPEEPDSPVPWTAPGAEPFRDPGLLGGGGMLPPSTLRSSGPENAAPSIRCRRAQEIAGHFLIAQCALRRKYKACFPWYPVDSLKGKVAYDIAFLVDRQRLALKDQHILEFYKATEYVHKKPAGSSTTKKRSAGSMKTSMLGAANERPTVDSADEALCDVTSRDRALRYWRRRGFNLTNLPPTWVDIFPEVTDKYWPKPKEGDTEKRIRYRY